MRPWMEKWGGVLLIFFCALVILFSALYTRQEDIRRMAAQHAAVNDGQPLEQAYAARYCAPVSDAAVRLYRGVYRSEGGLWRMDPFVYYAVRKDSEIKACCAGKIAQAQPQLIEIRGEEAVFRLQGDFLPCVGTGEDVTVGQRIAVSAQTGDVRLSLMTESGYADPLALFTP